MFLQGYRIWNLWSRFMPLPSFATTVFEASGKTSKSTPSDNTFPIPHQNLLRRTQSSDSIVAASDVSESSRCSMESSFEEETFVRRGISTTKADWQTSKAEITNTFLPESGRLGPVYDADETSISDSYIDLSSCSRDEIGHRIQLDPTNCFLKPADEDVTTEDLMTLKLRGGQLDTDEPDMVEDTDSEIFEEDYAQESQKSKFSKWLGTSSSKAKTDRPRSGFGIGRIWKSPAPEQSTSCFFDQEKESKNQSVAATAPKKLDTVEAMEKMNASLPSLNLRSAYRKA